jgi:hypothetical protein
MGKHLTYLLTILLLGFGTRGFAQEFSEDDLHDMGVRKTDIIDQIVHFSEEQKNNAVFIIMKYDDPNSTTGNSKFSITPQAERMIMETLDEARLAVYLEKIDTIHENLAKAYATSTQTTAPVQSPPSSGKKRRAK